MSARSFATRFLTRAPCCNTNETGYSDSSGRSQADPSDSRCAMNTRSLLVMLTLALGVVTSLTPGCPAAQPGHKPVLLYSRFYNAVGEKRYEPDGAYKQLMQLLQADFEVRMHKKPLTRETLEDVKLLLIVNPSDKAVSNNPAPPHVSEADIKVLAEFVRNGGGLIVSGNQENHNLEVNDMNRLLAQFGIQATNLYTDAKKLE